MAIHLKKPRHAAWILLAALAVTAAVYCPGLSGSWLFDDYPNIVDNPGVQPHQISVPALARAALSSPASEFKRPLASLSFAANYLAGGLNPLGWKLVNLLIHLMNGVLVFVLARALLRTVSAGAASAATDLQRSRVIAAEAAPTGTGTGTGTVAALVAAGWMLLPINLTAVLYVVQREESMANLFVLLGLIGYVAGRRLMLGNAPNEHLLPPSPGDQRDSLPRGKQGEENDQSASCLAPSPASRGGLGWGGFGLCLASLVVLTAIGVLVKETAVMLPLYAALIEWIVFRFAGSPATKARRDWRIAALFMVVLLLPMIVGLAWQLRIALNPASWVTRDFTLGTRLLSEARIVCDYLVWTLLPTPHALSFYHDQFPISTGLLTPWTTLVSLLFLSMLIGLVFVLRRRWPLVALGIALFLGCQLLTGTILPLELVYEHRNYFASFGVLLALVPLLAAPATSRSFAGATSVENGHHFKGGSFAAEAAPTAAPATASVDWRAWRAQGRYALLAALLLWWTGLTAITAYAWGDPLRLAQELAERAPDSPRAQYELGRTYIIYSHYDPASLYTRLAYAPLEKAASFPESSILPQQALIFMNSRMHLPIKEAWWDSLTAKLKARRPGVQDESSLEALSQCAREGDCDLSKQRMTEAYSAALSHPDPDARLLAMYGDYSWNVLDDHAQGLHMVDGAVKADPNEPAYQITLVRMLAAQGRYTEARAAITRLQTLNTGGRLDRSLDDLHRLPGVR